MAENKLLILNKPLSFVALLVKAIATGVIIITESHDPNIADTELVSANFLPNVLEKK